MENRKNSIKSQSDMLSSLQATEASQAQENTIDKVPEKSEKNKKLEKKPKKKSKKSPEKKSKNSAEKKHAKWTSEDYKNLATGVAESLSAIGVAGSAMYKNGVEATVVLRRDDREHLSSISKRHNDNYKLAVERVVLIHGRDGEKMQDVRDRLTVPVFQKYVEEELNKIESSVLLLLKKEKLIETPPQSRCVMI